MDVVVDIISTIVASIIAIIAIFQTGSQIRISNKHFLFERRLTCYNIFKGMYNLYKNNKHLLDFTGRKDEPIEVD